jgi:hypothetical protein
VSLCIKQAMQVHADMLLYIAALLSSCNMEESPPGCCRLPATATSNTWHQAADGQQPSDSLLGVLVIFQPAMLHHGAHIPTVC